MSNKIAKKPSREQACALIEELRTNPQLARGRITGSNAGARSQAMWSAIADRLNGIGGAIKTPAQWKKYWHDKKNNTKAAAAKWRTSAARTGGGPADADAPPLNELGQMVMAVMGSDFGEGIPNVAVPLFRPEPEPQMAEVQLPPAEDTRPQPRADTTPRPTTPPILRPLILDDIWEEEEEETGAPAVVEPQALKLVQTPPVAPRTSKPPKITRRGAFADTRTKIIEGEEKKIEILSNISNSLSIINNIGGRIATSLENMEGLLKNFLEGQSSRPN